MSFNFLKYFRGKIGKHIQSWAESLNFQQQKFQTRLMLFGKKKKKKHNTTQTTCGIKKLLYIFKSFKYIKIFNDIPTRND